MLVSVSLNRAPIRGGGRSVEFFTAYGEHSDLPIGMWTRLTEIGHFFKRLGNVATYYARRRRERWPVGGSWMYVRGSRTS